MTDAERLREAVARNVELGEEVIRLRTELAQTRLDLEYRMAEMAEARSKALEEAERTVRELRESHEKDAGDCREGDGCDYVRAWELAEALLHGMRTTDG